MKLPKINGKTIIDSFKTRSFRVGGYSVMATAIVLAIAVVVNLLVGALPTTYTQFDITADRVYSLSEQTKQVVGNLEQEVTVYWIVTQGQEDNYVNKLLTRVDALSDKLTVVRKDTDVNPTFAEKYTSDAVYSNSLVVECGQRYRYLDVNTDIYTYDYADYYTTGAETWYFNGEGALVGAIDYVTSDKLPKLYLLSGHGEQTLSTTFTTAIKNQNIETVNLSLLTVDAVPEDADAVLINAPASDISETELQMLREYAAAGGSILAITDIYTGQTKLPNVEALMADYGMHSVSGMIVETDKNHYFSMYQQAIQHAVLPTLNTHAITDPLINANYYVLFNGAHGILVDEELASELTVTELLTSSATAYSKQVGENLENYDKEAGDINGPFAMTVQATKNAGAEDESNVIWVSSPTLLNDNMNNYVSGGNLDLFLNMLSYLCEPEASAYSIHAKTVGSAKYLTMESGTAAMLSIWVVAIVPLAYLAWGVVVWFRRKRR